MGDQASIAEANNGFLETVFLDQDVHLPTQFDERSSRFQAKFHLKTQQFVYVHEDNDNHQTGSFQWCIHHQVFDYVLTFIFDQVSYY